MDFCKLQPTIKTKTGEEIPSPLYLDIMQNAKIPIKETKKIAQTFSLLAQQGIFNDIPSLELNEHGEPTFLSLLVHTNLGELLGYNNKTKEMQKIGNQLFSPETSQQKNTYENYTSMVQQAIDYNQTDSEHILLIQHEDSTDTLFYTLLPKTKQSVEQATDMQSHFELHNKLLSILEDSGIAVGTLTETEKRMRVNGVTAFATTRTLGENILELIRLQDGKKGYFALTEEFSHWLLDVTRDNPLTNRLLAHIKDKNLIQSILGAKYNFYVDKYQGDEEALLNEAGAHLVTQELEADTNSDIKHQIKTLLKKLITSFKALFTSKTEREIQKALREARNYAAVIAKPILDNTFERKRYFLSGRILRDLYQAQQDAAKTHEEMIQQLNNKYSRMTAEEYFEAEAQQRMKELTPLTSALKENNPKLADIISGIRDIFTSDGVLDSPESDEFGGLETIFQDYEGAKKELTYLTTAEKLIMEKDFSKEDLSDIIKELIKIEQKRYRIYKKHPNFEEGFLRTQFNLITSLSTLGELEALTKYVNSINVRLYFNVEKLQSLDFKANINKAAAVLVNIRRYLTSYQSQLPAILLRLNTLKTSAVSTEDKSLIAEIEKQVQQASSLYTQVQSLYEQYALPVFVSFLKPILGDAVEVPFKKAQQKMTLEEYIKHIPRDISMTDMLFDTLSQSSEPILQAYDQIFAEAANNARLNTISFLREKLFPLAKKFKALNITDTKWAFERDEEGNFTDYYIDNVKWGAYYKAKDAEVERLKTLYPDDKFTQTVNLKQWVKYNTGMYGIPKTHNEETGEILWANPEYEKLSDTQKELLEEFKTLKKKLEYMLPLRRIDVHNTIKIRKDLLERISSGEDAEGLITSIKTSVQDEFIRRCDDDSFGVSTITDFDNKPVLSLPLFYTTRLPGDTPNDVSTDLISTLAAYSVMAYNYDAVHQISSGVTLGLKILSDMSTVGEHRGNEPLVDVHTGLQIVKPFIESRIYKRITQASKHGISGISKEDEGVFGNTNIDKRKAADFLNKYTALSSYAFNGLSGLANILNGRIMQRVEAAGGDFYTFKDLVQADAIYVRDIAPYLAERGAAIKNSKMELWIERLNLLYEFKRRASTLNWDRSAITRNGFDFYAYFMDKSGNHWLQVRTSLAVSNHDKVYLNNEELSIYDSYEVAQIDSDSKVSVLRMKKGLKTSDGLKIITIEELKERAKIKMENTTGLYIRYTDPILIRDGEISEVTFMNSFRDKVAELNTFMFGNYDSATMVYAKSFILGSLAMMYRNYLKPALNYRFSKKQYNYRLGKEMEGYYRTVGRCILRYFSELKAGVPTSSLTEEEKHNWKRAAMDGAHVILFGLIIALVLDWDDDDNEPSWLLRMVDFMIRRLYRELGSLTPTPLMLIEGRQILKSPAAGINTLENLIGVVGLLNPFNYEFIAGEDALIDRGVYEDMSKAERAAARATPYKTIYKLIYPEEAAVTYKTTQN